MSQTVVEKILSRKAGREVSAGEFVVADLDFLFSHDANRPQSQQLFSELTDGGKVFDASRALLIADHAPSSPNRVVAEIHRQMEEFCDEQGMVFMPPGSGISHQVMPELGYVVPGDLVLGTDSHTCTQGAFNLMACGVGSTDMAVALAAGRQWFRVPETIRVVLRGRLQPGVYAKDVALALVGGLGADGATYRALEFAGEGTSSLGIGERMTITNLGVEMGAKTAIMPYDDVVAEWYEEHPPQRAPEPATADADASYVHTVEIDLETLSPQVAVPHNVDTVSPIEEVAGTPIQQGVIGTCANGRYEDLALAAELMEGQKVRDGVKLFCTPASREVQEDILRTGVQLKLMQAGAVMGVSGCSGCTGSNSLGIPANGQSVISSANRNFQGRLGNREAFTYLASPATVAASTQHGVITDPRKVVTSVS
jgi:3-isopropylmalate/(R)-2-methylmalate dehydratase large subunit